MKNLSKNIKKEIMKQPSAFNLETLLKTYVFDEELVEFFKDEIEWRKKIDTSLLTEEFFIKNKSFF